MLGWSGGRVDVDPKQIWHSVNSQKNGSNYINYSNPEVDFLIDKGRHQLNREDRIKTFKKVYRLIAEDIPYIFIFNSRNRFYGANNRVDRPFKNLNYDIGMSYWSLKL